MWDPYKLSNSSNSTSKIVVVYLCILVAVAFLTVAERKVMALMQRRKGPNVIGYVGLLQAFADGLKLFVKETTFPSNSTKGIYIVAPVVVKDTVERTRIPIDIELILLKIKMFHVKNCRCFY